MTTPLEDKFNRLQKKLNSRTGRDGKPRPGYEQNVAQIKAEMQIISGRIEAAQGKTNNGE